MVVARIGAYFSLLCHSGCMNGALEQPKGAVSAYAVAPCILAKVGKATKTTLEFSNGPLSWHL